MAVVAEVVHLVHTGQGRLFRDTVGTYQAEDKKAVVRDSKIQVVVVEDNMDYPTEEVVEEEAPLEHCMEPAQEQKPSLV